MILRVVQWIDQPVAVACDARCDKAWGINKRPRRALGSDPDDYVYVGDDDLEQAPAEPRTWEGRDTKPTSEGDRLNKWCARECERSVLVSINDGVIELPNLRDPEPNMRARHE